MGKVQIGIYSAGGFGREVGWLVEECIKAKNSLELVCFIDDDSVKQGTIVNDLPVLSLPDFLTCYPDAGVIVGVGSPATRRKMTNKVTDLGRQCITVIHPNVRASKWVTLGEGNIICAGNILTVNIEIGNHVHLNLDCTVGHDVIIGDYTTISPGVHISGCVHIGQGVFIGTGAAIVNGTADKPLVIGDGAVIGAGAVVTKNIEANALAVGVPAKVIRHLSSETNES